MKSTTWYWIGGSIVILLIIFFLLKNSKQDENLIPAPLVQEDPKDENQTNENNLFAKESNISYTNEGFSPDTLEIGQNARIVFTNTSDNPMWIASSPHPEHTDYSAFDQKGEGDTYTFTFSEIGTYTFHNHLNPSHTGTITVLPLK
ncbi:MAG: plastocyanin [Flavobacteriaceae bacterium]|jgi:plastocyanin